MGLTILDGKKLSLEILNNETQKLQLIQDKSYITPTLVVVTVGNDNASRVYVRNKQKACEQCGIKFIHETFDEDISRKEMIQHIEKLNMNDGVTGILIQQPVPKHLKGVEQYIASSKDVDGFTINNLGKTLHPTTDQLTACTPNGIITLLKTYGVPLSGKHIVIIGRSEIVGKPLIGLLLSENCTVTSCNSYTENLKQITQTADIIISAIGKPKYIDASYLSSKCYCVIDVGMNRDVDGKLCGDCDYDNIIEYWNYFNKDVERYITPVPGGVGPMTVASLIQNINKTFTATLNDELLKMIGGNK